ncbi:hypothetical protein Hbor_32060 (plasmid) [Halogeometricum borinquense DSM 11551]|uniref:Uncharacterized protein n=1 Tax=Halogeometricum borinquense (strain ATCC 700274 / DSM 11551 / JCM 10706 / KCTC 4070 / PR3) TaxID=469382 RepID=E4NUM1_HALBP|nr:hypothetical protein Hbor_32060 [Halogeometricum borinquense DSM 11551]
MFRDGINVVKRDSVPTSHYSNRILAPNRRAIEPTNESETGRSAMPFVVEAACSPRAVNIAVAGGVRRGITERAGYYMFTIFVHLLCSIHSFIKSVHGFV